MLKNKLYLRYFLICASYLFLMAALFFVGYHTGRNTYTDAQAKTVAVTGEAEISRPEFTNMPFPSGFRVILEDGRLRLYSDNSGTSRVLLDTEISEDSYPARDIALLKEGIFFNGQEEALALMENFLS